MVVHSAGWKVDEKVAQMVEPRADQMVVLTAAPWVDQKADQ